MKQMRNAATQFAAGLLGVAMLGIGFGAPRADAAQINYGNFIGSTIDFLNVVEGSGTDAVPLYGAPTPLVVGIGLDFNPNGFVATAGNGNSDLTDGQISFKIDGSKPNTLTPIKTISFSESGDKTLWGSGTPITSVLAALNPIIQVTEIDGVAVAPITLPGPFTNYVSYSLPPMTVVSNWSMSTMVDIDAALTALGHNYSIGATGVQVTANNQLLAFSELGTQAFIAKKDFTVGITVPEPASFGLVASAGLLLLRRRRA